MSRKINNNQELMVDLMEFSPYGVMSQMFIIEALSRYAKEVSEMTDEEVAEYDKKRPMISTEAWRGTARDIKKRMDEFYNPKKS